MDEMRNESTEERGARFAREYLGTGSPLRLGETRLEESDRLEPGPAIREARNLTAGLDGQSEGEWYEVALILRKALQRIAQMQGFGDIAVACGIAQDALAETGMEEG